MTEPRRALRPALLLCLAGFLAVPARAEVIEKLYVGTLSNPLTSLADLPGGEPDPATNPGLVSRSNRYVVKVSFDTDDLVSVDASTRAFQTRDFFSVPLGDAPGGTNRFELFLPSEGYGGVLTQTGQDHFAIDSTTAQSAEIHFFSSCNSVMSCDAAFRGFEFESNYIRSNSDTTPAPGGDLVFELRDPDANFSATTVTNHVVNVLDGNLAGLMFNGGHVDVRSESASASGGQLTPGVFLGEAVPVVAAAGATPLVYDASTFSLETGGGTALVTDTPAPIVPGTLRQAPSSLDASPRQADNDLGAGRSDGEDFLTYTWTVNGSDVAGSLPGTRLDRNVETLSVADPNTEPHGSRFANTGTRTVDDVNIAVDLVASGLTRTTDTADILLQVTEDITGFTSTDSVAVRYENALPVITTAIATPVAGDGLLFELGFDDADLAVNALGLADFELLDVSLLLDSLPFFGLTQLVATGSELLDLPALIALFGVGSHTLEVRVADRVLAAQNDSISALIPFTVVPEPGTLLLLLGGLTVLGARRA